MNTMSPTKTSLMRLRFDIQRDPETKSKNGSGSRRRSETTSGFSADSNIWSCQSDNQDNECDCRGGFIACLTSWLRDNLLSVLIIVSVVAGVVLGFSLRPVWDSRDLRKIWYLEFPGTMLSNILELLSIPLIATSLARAMMDLGKITKKLVLMGAVYTLGTMYLAGLLGIVMATSMNLGEARTSDSETPQVKRTRAYALLDVFTDLVSACIPDNIVTACFQTKKTEYKPYTFTDSGRTFNRTVSKPRYTTKWGTNTLGIMTISITSGLIVSMMGTKGRPLKTVIVSANELIMSVANVIIWYTPIGLMSLLAANIVSTEQTANLWADAATYVTTTILALAILGIYVLPVIFYLLTWKNPLLYFTRILKALLVAWGTASSFATVPVTMDCLINSYNINHLIANIVVPVGANINMCGNAMTAVMAAIYIAQVNGIDLSYTDLFIMSVVNVMAAVSAPGITANAYMFVDVAIILAALDLPTKDIALIATVDWFVDRFRTVLNVWSDAICAGILHHYYSAGINEPEDWSDQDQDQTQRTTPEVEEGPPSTSTHTSNRNKSLDWVPSTEIL